MKDYLLQFRDQVFNGAIALYKRIFIPYLLLNILVTLITSIVFIPLMLKFMGWSLSDLANLETTMQEMNKSIMNGENPQDVYAGLLSQMNFVYLIPMFIVGLFVFPWSYNLYFSLNNTEIREGNRSFSLALRSSFSKKILTLLGFIILYYLLTISLVLIFIFLVTLIMKAVQFLGIILGFVGIFFVIFFLIRFSLGPAAIVHGNMNISQAFAFSYSKLSMKRSALLFLMIIVIFVVIAIVGGLASLLVGVLISKNSPNPMAYFVVNQIVSAILSAITGAFLFAAQSALYFRYSEDTVERNENDHLVND